ncbi:MAG TPA: glycoside hydrolase family 3 C-terminal domain-containing protein [Gaiellaceae bacterium]|nr:glycoside hydrolase family 3 C-terminal domain-containing protein [Gaiellaceae bacterium]
MAAAPNAPYDLPVSLPAPETAPPVDAAAPYTPTVLSVLAQLETSPFTLAKIQNVDTLLHDGANANCHNVGPVGGPVGNDPSGSPTATTLAGNLTALFTNPDATHITVASATGLAVGQTLYVDTGTNADAGVISAISGTTITFSAPLAHTHAYGVPVTNDAAYSGAGQTFHNIKVASVTGFTAGETIWIDNMSNAEQVTIAAVGTAGASGSGLDLTGPITKVHPTGAAVFATFTTPSVTKICWTDAQGVLNTSGNNARGSTAPMTLMGLGATFDRTLANAWGQAEGQESREFMVTGMFGPQTDLDRLPNWGRNLTTTGEDPYLSHEFISAQIHGMQGTRCPTSGAVPATGAPCTPGAVIGAMSEMKHFVVYNGQNQNANTDIQDQSLHELYMTPYEGGFVSARAAATMCSYQIWRDTSTNPALVNPISALASGPSPYANPGENPETWPLDESHFSCEQPLSLNHVLRGTWGSAALVGSDYPATHSTSAITNGMDQEMPTQNGFLAGGNGTADPTGSTCAYYVGNPGGFTAGLWDPNCTSDSAHIGGLPNGFQGGSTSAGCPAPTAATGAGAAGGCTLNAAVNGGVLPLSVFNQSAARILYQLERFGMLGCDPIPGPTCTNPGGVGADRTGTANLPDGPTSGAPLLGTKNGDAAIVERYSEEGATLLKNDGNALPLTPADLAGGVFVTGSSANHTVADPTNEASTGFIGRNAVNPLQQLKALSGSPGAFTFFPANDPDGAPISTTQLSTSNSTVTGGLNLSIDGGPQTLDAHPIDHTAVNGNRLAPGHVYTWTGYLYVPTSDTYTFAIQQSDTLPSTLNCPQTGQFRTPPATPTLTMCTPFTAANAAQTNSPPDAVQFSFNGAQRNLNAVTANVYGATVPSNPTNAGYTDQGLISRTCATGSTVAEPGTVNCTPTESSLVGGTYYPISVTVNTNQCVSTPPAANAGTNPGVQAVLASCGPTSFRLAVTRAAGDIADAAAMSAGKSKAIVFVNTGSGTSNTAVSPPGTPYDGHTFSAVTAMSAANLNLITAVAAANPNTVVVINSDNPVDTSWSRSAKSILEMWFAGQEGGTSTARILLGEANPSGHTVLTWPANRTDTIWGYNEPANGLYPGSAAGQHLERLNGNAGCSGAGNPGSLACPAAGGTNESEGIYTGYRYFDKLGITPAFPFGFGLSYTTFGFSKLKVEKAKDGGLDVTFTIKNTGGVAGADAAQVYVGPPSDQPDGVQFAVRALAQFDRVELAPGASKVVTLHVDRRALSYWSDAKQQWVLDGNGRTLYVGDADDPAHLPLQTTVKLPARGDMTCSNEQINATTVEGNLRVEKGDWCDLVDVTVNGDLHIDKSSGVRLESVDVGGNADVNKTGAAADPLSAGTNVICNSTIGHDLSVRDSSAGAPWSTGACGPNTIGHDLRFDGNDATANDISGNTIQHNLTCDKNAGLTGSGNTVGGKKEKQCAGF